MSDRVSFRNVNSELTTSITIIFFKQANSLFQALCVILNCNILSCQIRFCASSPSWKNNQALPKTHKQSRDLSRELGVWMALTLSTWASKEASANQRIVAEHWKFNLEKYVFYIRYVSLYVKKRRKKNQNWGSNTLFSKGVLTVGKRTAEDCHLLVFLDACYKELVYCLLRIFRTKKPFSRIYFYSLKSITLLKKLLDLCTTSCQTFFLQQFFSKRVTLKHLWHFLLATITTNYANTSA